MSAFTSESLVRTKFQLTSTTDFPAALLADAIAEAHDEITARLDPGVNTDTPPDALITAETQLAGARTFRALAAREAANQRNLTVGGQRYDTATRHAQLLESANIAEQQAWETLAPFLAPVAARTAIALTDTVPILGATY